MDRILLKFSETQISKPITAQVILELNTLINILNAEITPQGGEFLVEVPSKDVPRVVKAFKDKGLIVTLQKRIVVDRTICIDCGACYSLCPVDAITFSEDYTVIFDEEKCISCGLCVDVCPTRAITI